MKTYLHKQVMTDRPPYADLSGKQKLEGNPAFTGIYLLFLGILVIFFYLSGFWSLLTGKT